MRFQFSQLDFKRWDFGQFRDLNYSATIFTFHSSIFLSIFSQGWEKNGLFEFYKAKLKYIKDKEKNLEIIEREQSPPPTPEIGGGVDDEEVASWIRSPPASRKSRSRSRSPRGRRSRSRSPRRR